MGCRLVRCSGESCGLSVVGGWTFKQPPITWNITVVKRHSAEVGSDTKVEAPLLSFSSQLTDAQRQDGLLLVGLPGQLQQDLSTVQSQITSPDRGRINRILGSTSLRTKKQTNLLDLKVKVKVDEILLRQALLFFTGVI